MFFSLGVLVSPIRAVFCMVRTPRRIEPCHPPLRTTPPAIVAAPLIPVVVPVRYACSMCSLNFPSKQFSSSQLKRPSTTRKCLKCMQIFKELAPVIKARCYGLCAYCGDHTPTMTKEHLVPQSCAENNPKYQIKLVCKSCNGDRGNNIDYKPYLRVMKQCPILKWKTTVGERQKYTTKNISPGVQATVCALLQQCTVNNKPKFSKVLQLFSTNKINGVYAVPSLRL